MYEPNLFQPSLSAVRGDHVFFLLAGITWLILHVCSVTQEHYHQWTLGQEDLILGLEVHGVHVC